MADNRENRAWRWHQYSCIAFFVFSFIALTGEQNYTLNLKYPDSNLYNMLDFASILAESLIGSILYCPTLSLSNALLNVKKHKNNYIKLISALLAAVLIIFLHIYREKY